MKHFRFETLNSGPWAVRLAWVTDDERRQVSISFCNIHYPGTYPDVRFFEIDNVPWGAPRWLPAHATAHARVYTDDAACLRRVKLKPSLYRDCTARRPVPVAVEGDYHPRVYLNSTGAHPRLGRWTERTYASGPDLLPLYRLCQSQWDAGGPGHQIVDWIRDLSVPLIDATIDFDGKIVTRAAAA